MRRLTGRYGYTEKNLGSTSGRVLVLAVEEYDDEVDGDNAYWRFARRDELKRIREGGFTEVTLSK